MTARCPGAGRDPAAVLAEWDRRQTATGLSQLRPGERLADALIRHIPDFAAMDEAGMVGWWERASKFPEEVWGSDGRPA